MKIRDFSPLLTKNVVKQVKKRIRDEAQRKNTPEEVYNIGKFSEIVLI